ncbi:hypothetical protein CLIB1423_07S04522 [[Candida] railenensis]|uniref:Uncharacterized protein n=1 Tax=[Candida] railenensis TaxID=45579 RepID=A0A9P0QQ29_9ASCO|nr:hypothetical protein CLIB1423_07S04522 [[Candida] railenensis]
MVFGSSFRRTSSRSASPQVPENPQIVQLRAALKDIKKSQRRSPHPSIASLITSVEEILELHDRNVRNGQPSNQFRLSADVEAAARSLANAQLSAINQGISEALATNGIRRQDRATVVNEFNYHLSTASQAATASQNRTALQVLPSPARARTRDEYNTVDEEIPPYNVTLHKYLDRISFDPRFAPCLRVNRRLVRSENELSASIDEFKGFNLLPTKIDPWTISHIDDLEFEDMIPSLIREVGADEDESEDDIHEMDGEQDAAPPIGTLTLHDGDYVASTDTLDRVLARSLLESEFYRTVPNEPPMYNRLR